MSSNYSVSHLVVTESRKAPLVIIDAEKASKDVVEKDFDNSEILESVGSLAGKRYDMLTVNGSNNHE